MPDVPDAFLSYTRFDDDYHNGKISALRSQLSKAVRAVTGDKFAIFQDTDSLAVGDLWHKEIPSSISKCLFFIPIITPSFFRNSFCMEELAKFVELENERKEFFGILPIYFISCDEFSDSEKMRLNPLIDVIASRQWFDWRELRFKSFNASAVKWSIEAIAREIQ